MNHEQYEEDLNDIKRHRQHGADIAADHRRGEPLHRIKRSIPYAAGVLLAGAVLYASTFAAGNEENHAPQPPAHLVGKLPPEQPPASPEGH